MENGKLKRQQITVTTKLHENSQDMRKSTEGSLGWKRGGSMKQMLTIGIAGKGVFGEEKKWNATSGRRKC